MSVRSSARTCPAVAVLSAMEIRIECMKWSVGMSISKVCAVAAASEAFSRHAGLGISSSGSIAFCFWRVKRDKLKFLCYLEYSVQKEYKQSGRIRTYARSKVLGKRQTIQ